MLLQEELQLQEYSLTLINMNSKWTNMISLVTSLDHLTLDLCLVMLILTTYQTLGALILLPLQLISPKISPLLKIHSKELLN